MSNDAFRHFTSARRFLSKVRQRVIVEWHSPSRVNLRRALASTQAEVATLREENGRTLAALKAQEADAELRVSEAYVAGISVMRDAAYQQAARLAEYWRGEEESKWGQKKIDPIAGTAARMARHKAEIAGEIASSIQNVHVPDMDKRGE